ncbi:MAG: hypothetical protein WC329_02665 [Candidatus Omnitrophota bacterium]|jgi:hypothetical protein
MKVEKEKKLVTIHCNDFSSVRGTIYINQGERLQDFINDDKRGFIVVTGVTVSSGFFKIPTRRNTLILNKAFIKCIEEG